MRIGLVCDLTPGGTITFTRAMDVLLRAQGHATTRVALRELSMRSNQEIGIENDIILEYSQYGNKHRLRKQFLKAVKDVDVIISSSYLPIVWRSREDSDIPHIHVEHLADPVIYSPFIQQRTCYDHCITVNRDVAVHIAKMLGEGSSVSHVRNPYLFPQSAEMHQRSSPASPGQRVVLFVGRVERNKGADLLHEIAGRSQEEGLPYVFEVVGPIHDRVLASRMAAMPSVRVNGSVHPDLMRKFYRNADIFLLISRSEAMSYALLEALDAECDVIIMNPNAEAASILDTDSNEAVGHICRESNEVLAILRRIVDHIPTGEERQRSKAAVHRYIDNEKTIRQYERIMHQVVASAKEVPLPTSIRYPTRLDYPWMPELPLRSLRTLIHGTSLFRWLKQTAP